MCNDAHTNWLRCEVFSICWNSIFIQTSRGRYYSTKLGIENCFKKNLQWKKYIFQFIHSLKNQTKEKCNFSTKQIPFFFLLFRLCAFMRSSSFFLNGWRSATQIKCSDKQTNIEWFLFLFHFASQYNLRLRWHSSVLEFQLILSPQIINFQFWNAHF